MYPKKTSQAFDKALRYISYQSRTESEVRKHLGSECSEELITRLKELNFINDEEFVKNFVSYHTNLSKKAILYKLSFKGLSPSINYDETPAATSLLKKKQPQNRNLAYKLLLSKGFASPTIELVLKKAYNRDYVS